MVDKWGITPSQYETWRTAVGFLNSAFLEGRMGPGTEAELEAILNHDNPGQSVTGKALRLAAGMTAIATLLIRIRHDETGKTPAETFAMLGRLVTPPADADDDD